MEIFFTEQFEDAYEKLTRDDKRAARKEIDFLVENIKHPGLRVKKMQGRQDIWEARVSKRIRLTFIIEGNTIILRNVGDHDRVLKNP